MELYKEIILKSLENKSLHITCPDLDISVSELVEAESYKALQKIKSVIEDDSFDDEECFIKIEEIIRSFEEIGSNGGYRHDFG